MKILVTNDDGIAAPGIWALAEEFKTIARVVVVAPDRERSAIGTAVTLFQPIRVEQVTPQVSGVEAYKVDGTPADCVIWGLGGLTDGRVDMVVSGINQGTNLGDDALISGTVGAALHGYLYGLPALAISACRADDSLRAMAARLAVLLVNHINRQGGNVLLNVNLPALPLADIHGIKVTQLASGSHTMVVAESGTKEQGCYQLVRRAANGKAAADTDLAAFAQGSISITPLHTCLLGRTLPMITDSSFPDLFADLKNQCSRVVFPKENRFGGRCP